MKLVVPSSPGVSRQLVAITPESAGWKYVGFEVHRLGAEEKLIRETGNREMCLVMLTGKADVSFGSRSWIGVGGRSSLFDGPADSVYAPPGGKLIVASASGCEFALGSAPASAGADARLIHSSDVQVFKRGADRTERTIHNILMEDSPAESLLVTEVYTPGGNWSSYPPHKHDTDDPPRETYLEETYYHRLARPSGFAVQLVYSSDRSLNEALVVHDGDVVLVPRGYHPVAAGPGYDLYYLNVMAGPVRKWCITTDPDHRWQLG